MNKRKLLIDTDTASDDAVALIMALRSSELEVVGITVVAGNCSLEQATSNALYTTELCGSAVPVYIGENKPLQRELQVADWFHGRDGLGDHGFKPKHKAAEKEPAIEAIIRLVKANSGLELITLGPLSNVARALQRDRSIAEHIARCVVMGGAPHCEGNVTPAAEFNIWVDPEAARHVFHSGLKIEMVGWQLCREDAVFNAGDIAALRDLNTELADFAVTCNSTAIEAFRQQTGEAGISLPDPVAMGILLQPDLCLQATSHYVDIETQSDLTRGMTVVDRLNVSGDARNAATWTQARRGRLTSICWKLDVARWKRLVMSSLADGSPGQLH